MACTKDHVEPNNSEPSEYLKFTQMVLGQFKGDIYQIRKDLLEYCKLDTFAMFKILEKLIRIGKQGVIK